MKNEPSVSFVIPTFNVEKYISKVLESIKKQRYPLGKMEIIIVDDNSTDKTLERIAPFRNLFSHFKIIVKNRSQSKGAAVSTNIGIKESKRELIALVDGDAVLASNWIQELIAQFEDPKVGMAAGAIKTANPENLWAAFAGRELEDRYAAIKEVEVDHVSTCNTIYRRELFNKVGMFDESLFYGYDADMSYRVREKGYKILLIKNTYCLHYWRETFKDYLNQLHHTGYARLRVLEKFPDTKVGGKVSGWKLIIQTPLTLGFLLVLPFAFFNKSLFYLSVTLFAGILVVQFPQTIRIIKKHRDFRFIFFPPILVLRNLVWVWVFFKYNIDKVSAVR